MTLPFIFDISNFKKTAKSEAVPLELCAPHFWYLALKVTEGRMICFLGQLVNSIFTCFFIYLSICLLILRVELFADLKFAQP